MKVIDNQENLYGSVATIGSFDGIHLGHKKIFEDLRLTAYRLNLPSVIITFQQHPRFVLQPHYQFKLLTTLDEKMELISKENIDLVQFLKFDNKMASLNAEEFVKYYLVNRFNIKALVIGFNHKFGKSRSAGYKELSQLGKKYNFEVYKTAPVLYNKEPISSSRIRKALDNCQLQDANNMLGYKYFFSGKVVEGKKLGYKIGFPTANLLIDKRKQMPCSGVYAVFVKIDNSIYQGVMNYGKRPTIDNDQKLIPEIHILNFSGNLYNKRLKVSLIKFIRREQNFSSINQLKKQIQKDILTTKKIFTKDI